VTGVRLSTVEDGAGTAAAIESEAGPRIVADDEGRAYADVGDLLRRAPDWRAAAARASRDGRLAASGAKVLRPVLAPGATVCVGLNYRKHILEMKREMPTVPTLFSKLARALTDPGAAITLPKASQMVDYEGELCVVIGARGRDIPLERAWDHVAGLTLMNDVTMREFQKRSLQWFAGKSWERATPVGPVVVTLDELPDLGKREITTRVNGEVRQRSELQDLVFDVPTLVADLSRVVTLEPGDLIATGTPGGVGDAMKPPSYLRHGDRVEVTIDGIGTLVNTFEAAS